ncbi:MAG: YbaN family protein [Methanomassiliicoccales archaeon]
MIAMLEGRRIVRSLYVMAGSISLAVGVVGIVVPLLPTTPFLLLAAACYARGSKRLERWMNESPLIGPYLQNYRRERAMCPRSKAVTLLLLWIGMGLTILLMVDGELIRWLLLIIAVAVSLHILTLGRPSTIRSG